MWPALSMSAGFRWQAVRSYGAAIDPAMWEVWAPSAMGAAFPQVARGGAPVVLSMPPWHAVQSAKSLATPPVRWHPTQATPVKSPDRSAPWQLVQEEIPRFAE
jgi:hypothetical protein